MKDLLTILLTTILIGILWGITKDMRTPVPSLVTQQVLEISTPINGRIDTEYLKTLEE